MKKHSFQAWEWALLLALCITFAWGAWAQREQTELAQAVVRLHVIANSDSDADQAEKLQMRDKVLALVTPLLQSCQTQDEAIAVLQAHQAELEALGDAAVSIGTEYYPTRDYNTFSLPAGRYVSLQVTLGGGQGRNWWCVVFPPLCTEALAQSAQDAFLSLDEEQTDLITQDGPSYQLRFRLVDWWGELTQHFPS
jgi:stage II sporulation protein R